MKTSSSVALDSLFAQLKAITAVCADMERFLETHRAALDAYASRVDVVAPRFLGIDHPLSGGTIYLRRHEENAPAAKALCAALGGEWTRELESGCEYFRYTGKFPSFTVQIVCAEFAQSFEIKVG